MTGYRVKISLQGTDYAPLLRLAADSGLTPDVAASRALVLARAAELTGEGESLQPVLAMMFPAVADPVEPRGTWWGHYYQVAVSVSINDLAALGGTPERAGEAVREAVIRGIGVAQRNLPARQAPTAPERQLG